MKVVQQCIIMFVRRLTMNNRNKPSSEFNTPGGILIRLKNKLLARLRIDATRLNLLVDKYAVKLNGGRRNAQSQSDRTNLLAALNRKQLSINKFFSFLMALDLKSVKITITIETKDGDVVSVEEKAIFRNESLEENLKDEVDK